MPINQPNILEMILTISYYDIMLDSVDET